MFLKKSNTLTTTPNPIDPLTLTLDLAPPVFFFLLLLLHSPGFELQTSDFEVHLHLHYATQTIVANWLIFVGLVSYWSQTHPSPLTQITGVTWFADFNPV